MRVLMVTMLDVWSMGANAGAQSLYETLRGYAAAGHRVHLVCHGANGEPLPLMPDGVTVERLPALPGAVRGAARALRRVHASRAPAAPKTATRTAVNGSSRPPAPIRHGYVPGGPAGAVEAAKIKADWAAFQLRLARRLPSLARQDHDVVYGYEVHAFPAAGVLARMTGRPLVARFQGTILAPALGSRLNNALLFEHRWALATPAALTIMTDDGTQGDRVLDALGVARRRVRFWRNGIDLSRFGPAPENGPHHGARPFRLLTASRLVYWKHVDRAIELLAATRARGLDATLEVIGDGSDRTRLEALAASLGITPWVRFAGRLPHSELASRYAAADLFVSLHDLSNVANPLYEAMATGLPVITLDVGDTRTVIDDGANGVLLPRWDPELAADAACALAADAGRRDGLGAAARRWTVRHMQSWPARMAEEIRLVERLARA